MNITPGKWKVMYDPEKVHKHPYHDRRFIMTGEWHWTGDYYEVTDGEIICKMMDGKHQLSNARLIASAPELLEALISMVDQACEQYPHFESPRGQENINRAKEIIGRIGGL